MVILLLAFRRIELQVGIYREDSCQFGVVRGRAVSRAILQNNRSSLLRREQSGVVSNVAFDVPGVADRVQGFRCRSEIEVRVRYVDALLRRRFWPMGRSNRWAE